jgi:hypothetical protein
MWKLNVPSTSECPVMAGGGSSGAAVAANYGGRHARARLNGQKQTVRRSSPQLGVALLGDKIPLNRDEGGSSVAPGSGLQRRSVQRRGAEHSMAMRDGEWAAKSRCDRWMAMVI